MRVRLLSHSLGFLLAGAVCVLAAGCAKKRETAVEAGNRDQIIHIGNLIEPNDLDPHLVSDQQTFNIVGSLTSGYLGNVMPKRFILSFIYFTRALSIVAFVLLPTSVPITLAFAVITGFTWLSTVPPTSGLVAVMFGTRWLAMLYGFAFFSHQVGGFLGVLLGGYAFAYFGSYNPVWYLSIFFCLMSSLINLPIVEKPIARAEMQTA